MTNVEIRELTSEELVRSLDDRRRELFNLRMQLQTGQLEDSARIRHSRREVARMLTEQTMRNQSKQS